MRKPFICGNWKMHKRLDEALELVKGIMMKLDYNCYERADVAVAPPFVYLSAVSLLVKATPLDLCAQDVFWEKEGAYTGEVSPVMLKDVGCDYCIVGHSERRTYFCETDETVNKKVKALIEHEITPIVCVGERLEEREAGKVFEVVGRQIREGLAGVKIDAPNQLVIAYEPVWAIGTGKVATPQQAQEVHSFIRELLREMFGAMADSIRILYGGSVKPNNIASLIEQEDIDGALVGGASLSAPDFTQIVKIAGGC